MSSGDLSFRRRWSGDVEILPTDFRWNGRPLVVIDPEDREKVKRLASLYELDPDPGSGIDLMQAALREFANPKPPKPEEPTGLGAVVEDADGEKWVYLGDGPQAEESWRLFGDDIWEDYSAIDVVRVLSEGVTP